MNIVLNTEFEVILDKKNNLTWLMCNCSRDFFINNKNSKYTDFDLIDKIIHAVPVETTKTLNLFHHLIYKTIPVNLRPFTYTAYRPSPVHDKEMTSLN